MRVVKGNIEQITLDDRRWYYDSAKDEFAPSITWILDAFPKDKFFHQYLADLPSWEFGQKVLHDAGDRGSRVHWACEQILKGATLKYTDIPYGYHKSFAPHEWRYIMSFANWLEENPGLAIVSIEETVWGEGYAGTCDLLCYLDGVLTVIDWKTSSGIYDSYKCQNAAYCTALGADVGRIVQLGTRSKKGYKEWTTDDESGQGIEYYFNLFQHVKAIWQHQNPNPAPRFMDVPTEVSLLEIQTESEATATNDTAN